MKKRMRPQDLRFITLIAIAVGFGLGVIIAIGTNINIGLIASIVLYLIVLGFLSRSYE